MSQLLIAEGTQVLLHFALKLENGETVDSTFEKEPAKFVVGDGNLLPGFESVLMGMSSGEKQTFVIQPDQGFGESNPDNVQRFKRHAFNNQNELQPGLVVNFTDQQNHELSGVVSEVGEEYVTVDFNHPLAGKPIHFEVEILSVDPVVTH